MLCILMLIFFGLVQEQLLTHLVYRKLLMHLRGANVPVLIKNPINPDLELWIGAVERVAKAGIKNIGFIHRGFSSYGNTEYRNAPMWHLAIEMKRRNPEYDDHQRSKSYLR